MGRIGGMGRTGRISGIGGVFDNMPTEDNLLSGKYAPQKRLRSRRTGEPSVTSDMREGVGGSRLDG